MNLRLNVEKVCFAGMLFFACFFYAHAYPTGDVFADFVESDTVTTQVPKVNIPANDPIFRLDYLACSLDENEVLSDGDKKNIKPSRALVDRMLNFLKNTPNQTFAIHVLMNYALNDDERGKDIFAEMGKIAMADERQYTLPVILGMNADQKNDPQTAMKFFHCAADRILTNEALVRKLFDSKEIDGNDISFVICFGSKCAIQCHDTAFLKKVDDFLENHKDSIPFHVLNQTVNCYADLILADEFQGYALPVPVYSVSTELLRRLPKLVDFYLLAMERLQPKDFERDDLFTRSSIVVPRLVGSYSRLPYYLQILAMKYPSKEQILVALTDIYTDLKQYDEAYYTLKRYFAYFSHLATVNFYQRMAELCFLTERSDEGVEMYRRAMTRARVENLDALVKQLATEAFRECFRSHNYYEAMEFAEIMPMDKFANVFLKIFIYEVNGRKDDAYHVLESNIDFLLQKFPIKSKHSERDFNFLVAIGFSGKNVIMAEKIYAFGMTNFKDKANYQNSLAYFYACNNIKLDEAEPLAKSAVENAPEKAPALDTLAWVYYRQGKFELAERTMGECFAVSERTKRNLSAVEYFHLGDIQFELKKYRDAVKNWLYALELYDKDIVDEFTEDDLYQRLQKVEDIIVKNKRKVAGKPASAVRNTEKKPATKTEHKEK